MRQVPENDLLAVIADMRKTLVDARNFVYPPRDEVIKADASYYEFLAEIDRALEISLGAMALQVNHE